MSPEILIQFPTRQRPEKFLEVAKKYFDLLGDKENTFMHVSCDVDDETMSMMIDAVNDLADEGSIFISFNENKSKIQAVNAGIEDFDFDIILVASDDMIPQKRGYDNIIRRYFDDYFPDFDGVLHFDDGHQHQKINTLPVLGKKYYDRFGYVYHESYKSIWADNEFDEVSRLLDKRIYIDNVIIKHEHPSFTAGVLNDDLNIKNSQYDVADRNNFLKRKSNKFNL